MHDLASLLATLSQSSAAVVAIIGGFLVSRLVAISSEREGIKRQLKAARGRLALLQADYEPVHEYRLNNSVSTMEDWLLDKLINERADNKDLPTERLLDNIIPRGSSVEEMLPYAEKLRGRVDRAFEAVLALLEEDDTRQIEFTDLQKRGLKYDNEDEDIYEQVFNEVRRYMPRQETGSLFGLSTSPLTADLSASMARIRPAGVLEVETRRLDESIREETQLGAQLKAAEQEVDRLQHDLATYAQPVGVVSAVVILGVFSILGIVVPLLFMAFGPEHLAAWVVAVLLGCFILGLAAVLSYIVWYLHTLRD